jgi:tRNA threonylcarbamoyladenosine biosynthesis protein TsaE
MGTLMKITIKNKRELPAAARKILKHFREERIFAFYGAMGSGKTTIIKAICEVLGAVDIVSSPSFTLVNEYITANGESLYHIDFYRIRKTEEVFDFGIEEYLSEGNYCFMEWPELVEGILPSRMIRIKINVGKDEERILELP